MKIFAFMRNLMPLLFFSLLAFSLKAYAQEIPEVSAEDVEKQQDSIGESIENGVNQFLYKHGITPTTISYHPNGEVLISTQYFKELKGQYMLLVDDVTQDEPSVDTLSTLRPNRSKFSDDGSFIIYNEIEDKGKKGQQTYLRKYSSLGEMERKRNLKEELNLGSLYYFSMDKDGIFYYYAFFGSSSDKNGIYASLCSSEPCTGAIPIYLDTEELIYFSPLRIGRNMLLMAVQGKNDSRLNGIYFARYRDGRWRLPLKVQGLRYGYSFDFVNDNIISYKEAVTGNVIFVRLDEILKSFPEDARERRRNPLNLNQ